MCCIYESANPVPPFMLHLEPLIENIGHRETTLGTFHEYYI